jgi:CheY-like chemotaxis protein
VSQRRSSGDDPPAREGDPHRDLEGTLHEVSNALTVLLGWIAEARAPGATNEEVTHALRVVDDRARRARDLARRAIGAQVASDVDALVGDVVADAVASLAVEAQRVGARIDLVRGGDATARVALAQDVAQIVTNLVLNALAYAPRGSTVRVALDTTPSEVTLEVDDQGPGVPAEQRATVFDGDTRREGGAGVGLRHARAIARAAGGDLVLLGEGGARFRLAWPRIAPRHKPVASGRHRTLSLAGARVLVVEDDEGVTDLLEAGLGAKGASVTIARTAEELSERLKEPGDPPDAILMDLSPIAADPSGAVARVRQAAPGAAVVFVTGSGDALPDGIEGAELVRKPFELSEIVGALLRARERGS